MGKVPGKSGSDKRVARCFRAGEAVETITEVIRINALVGGRRSLWRLRRWPLEVIREAIG